MEATKVSCNRVMNKQTLVYTYSGILINAKKKQAIQLQEDIKEHYILSAK